MQHCQLETIGPHLTKVPMVGVEELGLIIFHVPVLIFGMEKKLLSYLDR